MIETSRSIDRTAALILALGILYILGPLYLALTTASQSYAQMLQDGISWLPGDQLNANIRRVWSQTRIPQQLANSLIVALGHAILTCLLSFLTACALVWFRLRWAGILFALILATIMLPLDIRVVTTYQVAANVFSPLNAVMDLAGIPLHLELSILDTHAGLILPLIAHGTGTFLFRQFFMTLPRDLFKAARMDGAGPWRFMWDILLPLSRGSVAALFVLSFLSGWTQYLWPLVGASRPEMQTAVVGLARLLPDNDGRMPDYPMIMAGAVIVSVIPLAMIALLQRFLVRGLVMTEK